VRRLAQELAPQLRAENFRVGAIEAMPFEDSWADVVLCSSVLHFARDEQHFLAMIEELWRVLRPGGMLFCRLGSRIGMEFPHLRGHIYRIGDGSEWFLVDEEALMTMTAQMDALLVDPLKTTIVQNHRCMTTWVTRKRR
jgi:ubiquinone/menaquinone biosynthesis C-methylase UbiE